MGEFESTPAVDKARDVILGYLERNYPCSCADEDCCGNYFEADDIVRTLHEHGLVIREE